MQNDMMQKTIVVVDDDVAILEATQIILESKGYHVITATDRAELYTCIATSRPDMILLDIWLQGDSGEIIAQELKAQQQTRKIPIVIISANFDGEKIAKKAGANSFLAKPFSVDDLLLSIEHHTKNKVV